MVNKITKTHSVHNGHTKKTLTFSTEENNLPNEIQAVPFNQSTTFHGPNAPVTYGFFDDFWKTFTGGFEKLGTGIITGDFGKITEGIGSVVAPGIVTGANALSSPAAEFSHSPDMSLHSELILF